MAEDLLSQAADSADFAERAVSPMRELGAYEALWAREGAWFKSILAMSTGAPLGLGNVAHDSIHDVLDSRSFTSDQLRVILRSSRIHVAGEVYHAILCAHINHIWLLRRRVLAQTLVNIGCDLRVTGCLLEHATAGKAAQEE